jgi:hypothetical protein
MKRLMEYCLLLHDLSFETSILMMKEIRLRMSQNRTLRNGNWKSLEKCLGCETRYTIRKFMLINYVSVVRFEVFTAVTMKNATYWNVTLCG